MGSIPPYPTFIPLGLKKLFCNEPHSSPTFFPPQNQFHRLPPSEPNTVSLPKRGADMLVSHKKFANQCWQGDVDNELEYIANF